MGIENRVEVVRTDETRPVALRIVVDVGPDGWPTTVQCDKDVHIQVLCRLQNVIIQDDRLPAEVMIQGDFKPASVAVVFKRSDK